MNAVWPLKLGDLVHLPIKHVKKISVRNLELYKELKSTEDEVINLLFLVDLMSAVQNNSNMYFIMYIICMLMYVYKSERMTAITKGWEGGMRLIWLV